MTDPTAAWSEDEFDEEMSMREHDGLWRRGTFARHRKWWVIGSLAVLAGLVVAVVWGWSATRGVLWTNTGFDVVSDRVVTVRFDVNRDPGKEVVCVLRAQDIDHASVGRTEVTVPPAEQRVTRQEFELRTTHRAVTGFVDSCRYK